MLQSNHMWIGVNICTTVLELQCTTNANLRLIWVKWCSTSHTPTTGCVISVLCFHETSCVAALLSTARPILLHRIKCPILVIFSFVPILRAKTRCQAHNWYGPAMKAIHMRHRNLRPASNNGGGRCMCMLR